MHTPSRPEDLDHPELLWARAVTMALVDAACNADTEFALDDDGLWCHSTGACGWWRLTVLDGGRAVFCGQDPDGSHTHVGGEQIDFRGNSCGTTPPETSSASSTGGRTAPGTGSRTRRNWARTGWRGPRPGSAPTRSSSASPCPRTTPRTRCSGA